MTTPLTAWTYRDHAAGDHDAALASVRARALRGVPEASIEILSERPTATGWSFEIHRCRAPLINTEPFEVRGGLTLNVGDEIVVTTRAAATEPQPVETFEASFSGTLPAGLGTAIVLWREDLGEEVVLRAQHVARIITRAERDQVAAVVAEGVTRAQAIGAEHRLADLRVALQAIHSAVPNSARSWTQGERRLIVRKVDEAIAKAYQS